MLMVGTLVGSDLSVQEVMDAEVQGGGVSRSKKETPT